ncbi:MAG TPA: translation elongation factor 4, partial [Jatrophihabitans sp.]|uniref:translation elongation factor 4 n=1 Tax=Jatrophihabitans sp. TaxID=1932789 RepID=UPI002F195705
RGITIKSQAVRMPWDLDGSRHVLNMIDTPGHVDFTYEVSRSLAACEGAVLLVDAAQGIEAQTLANLYLALENDLQIIPVLNKIDLPAAQPDVYALDIAHIIGCEPDDVLRVSAKTGQGVEELLDVICRDVPPPVGDADAQARAMIFDSVYDIYRGVITYVRVIDGHISPRQKIKMMSTGATHELLEVGVISPEPVVSKGLGVGEVGYLITGVKDVRQSKVGDTVTDAGKPAKEALGGYRDPNPMVYSGLFPIDGSDFPLLRDALDRLRLNDAALVYEPESSGALGFGFRCGFLGLLHLEITRDRLEREFNLELISTAPNVVNRVILEDGREYVVTNPSDWPSGQKIAEVYEPIVKSMIIAPSEYIGAIMELCQTRRGTLLGMDYLSETRVELRYTLPLGEIIFDFFDALKSRTRGYASLDYEEAGEQTADLVKVDILLQGEPVDAFSAIVHKDKAYAYGVMMTTKLRELIPRQQFEVPIQAAIGSRVIARESIRAIRKDVLAKCYGGDITRKRKLLEKQKEGKKRMKMVGRVEVPQEAFIAALSTTESPDSGKK